MIPRLKIFDLTARYLVITIILLSIGCLLSGGDKLYAQMPTQTTAQQTGSDTVRRVGTAWTLTTPLGMHKKAAIDTLLYNYQRQWIPSMRTDGMATTGAFGGAGINMIYIDRPAATTFFFDDAWSQWLPSINSMKFYNVYVPMTLLSYNFGGGKNNHLDRLNMQFAGNVNRNIGVGAHIDYLHSKGCYEDQAAKDFNFSLSSYYTGNRYEMQIFYYHFNQVNKENGGITDDLYITDPAVVQGGIEKVEPKSIPVNLSDAYSRISGDRLFTTHALKLGYWREEMVNDTLTRQIYVPVTRFIYSLDYEGRHHMFKNRSVSDARNFWTNTYLNPSGTDDNTRYWAVSNTFGVEMMEGFRKWAKFGMNAYVTLQTRCITQTTFYDEPELTEEQRAELTPIPDGWDIVPRVTQNRLWVGGQISKRQGRILHYSANAKFGLVGGVAGDISVSGDVETNFRLLKDTVSIEAHGGFSNVANSYLLSHYISNHFVWQQSLGKTRTAQVGGSIVFPWTKTKVTLDFRNIQNLIYFNKASLPTQYAGNVQVFSARLDQKLKFGIWNWNNTITYQVSSEPSVLPLPALALYSNMFLNFRLFRVLDVQMGIDCNYFTRYYGLEYQPATMTFHVQDEIKVGNYPLCNAYVDFKLYKVRFYLLFSHVNQGWFGKNYFSMPHYPINPRMFQMGLSIDFAN